MTGNREILKLFRSLHRTRQEVFKNDLRTLEAARLKINEEFKKNKEETSSGRTAELIKIGSDVEAILRTSVVQGVRVNPDRMLLILRKGLQLNDLSFTDSPTKKS
uniref:Complex III assembly factor LYRM7 n=1 Tax=Pogona vitticeps TaxID=103695 RepID=A0A6J0TXE2_9SAUR